jgi:hypothetical protein
MKKAGRKSRVRVPLKVSKIMFVGPVTDTILYRFLFYTKMLAVPNVTILHFIWYGIYRYRYPCERYRYTKYIDAKYRTELQCMIT